MNYQNPEVVWHIHDATLPDGTRYRAQAPYFLGYQEPKGHLPAAPEAHALFLYALTARDVYEKEIASPLFYEGDIRPEINFRKIFEPIMRRYKCDPDRAIRYWEAVDAQFDKLGLPKLPDEERYRFNRIASIELH